MTDDTGHSNFVRELLAADVADWAVALIRKGKAYVDSLSTEAIRERVVTLRSSLVDGQRVRVRACGRLTRTAELLVSVLVPIACALSPQVRDDGVGVAGSVANEATGEPAREVPIDTRIRPAVHLALEMVDANDADRGTHLATQLERFRPCVDRYRTPRGFAGGRFSVGGYIQPDGTLTQSRVFALDYGEGFERCLAPHVAALTWPATGFDVRVGFSASIVVHDTSRRAPDEVRPSFPRYGGPPGAGTALAPQIFWSELEATSSSVDALRDELDDRSGVLADCLWHASPTPSPSADAVVVVRVASSGKLSARVRGEYEAPAPELVECLGRMLSVMSAPAGSVGEVHGHLTVGASQGKLGAAALPPKRSSARD